MITRNFPIDTTLQYNFEPEYETGKIVFFDIETTGFSADMTYLYLIGCAYYKDSSFHLIQWFAEDIREESQLITSFFEFIQDYDAIIHYNGSGFDIPYLMKKCSLLRLDYSFDCINSLDLYKEITPYKKILKLPNYKQKSIETFLKIDREDVFSGGDLIEVYQSYLGKKHLENLKKMRNPKTAVETTANIVTTNTKPSETSEAEMLLYQLLLHNEDDIKGLIRICPILNYVDLFQQPIHIMQAGVDQGILTIRFETSVDLPVRISFGNDIVHFTSYGSHASLNIHIYEGELKYFYDNYKDYYYLPSEDTAVHKSVALYVDKDYRQKAKPSTCYTRKQGIFAPQYEPLITPYFKTSHQDKLTFLEIHTDFLLQEKNLQQYVAHMMRHLINSK